MCCGEDADAAQCAERSPWKAEGMNRVLKNSQERGYRRRSLLSGAWGVSPRFIRPGREPSFRGRTCDVAEASRDFSSSLLDALEVRGAIH